jgi:hypothetical protein
VSPVLTVVNSAFCEQRLFVGFLYVRTWIISLNSVNQLMFVTVKCCVFFAVRTELLNTRVTKEVLSPDFSKQNL